MSKNETQLGINNGYLAWMRAQWQCNPTNIQPDWQQYLANGKGNTGDTQQTQTQQQTQNSTDLAGVSKQIAINMQASLEVPTATSCRDVPTKVLEKNRAVINQHLQGQNKSRCSFTHLIAYAIVQAMKDHPSLQSYCQRQNNRFTRVTPGGVNLGLAMDLPTSYNRTLTLRALVVPNIKQAESLNFAQFMTAYNDLVQRAKESKLQPGDFQGTLVTLTNPGTLGTVASLPRLMQQQALIIATGRIGYPAWTATMDPHVLQQLQISKVMTLTSTYDHRIIQGAESGQFLAHVHALLVGENNFYE
ncbi:MAG: 2-oxo acid dehydrogenase subunit E2, partial [Myxococcota bacterium]